MITFYLDGFRGFEKTFLPLRDVNFFVGENSTGKTSVMAAIHTLSDPQCWITGRLRSDHVDLGAFDDIAPRKTKFFRIGYSVQGGKARARLTTLIAFGPGKGAPEAICVDAARGTILTRIVKKGAGVYIGRWSQLRHSAATLSSWADKAPLDIVGMDKLPGSFPGAPLVPVLTLHLSHLDRKTKATTMLPAEPPMFQEKTVWMAPIRAKPRRSYERYLDDYSPEGEHLPHLLEVILSKKQSAAQTKILGRYGSASGLFKSLGVRRFGDDERSPYEISVDLGDLVASIFNVGYGVSQALPVVAEIIAQPAGTWFAIQQPEVHLHPRAQAAMGDLFFQMAGAPHDKRFIIETHSDYVVDRFCSAMRKATDAGKPVPSAQVVFFRREGGRNVLYPLELSPRGEYPEDQPPGFREFFLQEQLTNLGY